ncbi:hypothetical protein GCM10020331_072900 [Ectobacillus funiculus]
MIDTISTPQSSLGAVIYGNELWIGGHGSGAEINENVYIYEGRSLKQKGVCAANASKLCQ